MHDRAGRWMLAGMLEGRLKCGWINYSPLIVGFGPVVTNRRVGAP